MVTFTPSRRVPMRIRDWQTPMRAAQRRRLVGPTSGIATTADDVALKAFRVSNKFSARGPRTTGTLRQQVKALQSWSRRHAPEQKYFDSDIGVSNVTTAGSVQCISEVPSGAGSEQRVGDVITVTSIVLKGQQQPDTDSFSRFYHRVLLVQDKQGISDTAPVASDIIDDLISAAPDPIICLPNTINTERFNILWVSELFDNGLGSNQNSANNETYTQTGAFECVWNGNIRVAFNGTAGTDIQKNALYVVHLTNSTAGTVDWTGVSRITYTDS